MNSSFRALLLILVGMLVVWSAPASVHAQAPATEPPTVEQTDEQPEAKAAEEETPTVSDEIIVTARKREENVQEVPVAVTVVGGEALQEAATSDISELQSSVPNLSIYQGRNQTTTLTAFMRGIGQADPLWGVDPGVGLYLDDVYIARPQGALLDVYDVQRIEVLRGPQGTLYGKNTIGGAIKYVSRELTDDLGGQISVSPGSYSNQDFRASVSGALIPGKLRGKIAAASLKHDGYGTNRLTGRDVSDKDTTAFRGALDWLASDRVKVQLSHDQTKDSAEPKGYRRLAANPLCPAFLGRTCPPLSNNFDTESGLAPLNSTDASGTSLIVGWKVSDAWDFKSITAYRKSDSDNNIDFDTTPARITDVIATYFDKQTSEELQFLYDGGEKFTGVFGAYYFKGKAGGLVKNIFLNRIFGTTEGETNTDSIAIFGDGSYQLTSDLRLNLGLRATREKKNGIALNRGFTNDTFTVPNAVTADFDKTETFDSVAPKLGLDYQVNPNVLAYVTLSRGFKSGGFNVRAQATVFPASALPFKDEVLDVAEVGLKTVLLDRQLVLNTAAFWGKYKDIQVSTFTAFDSNGDGVEDAFFGNFINAGDATMKGIEVEFDGSPHTVTWLRLVGNVSYLSAKPDEFLDANHDGFVDTQVITNAPEFTGALHANLSFPISKGLITGSVGVAYRDDSVLTNEGGPYPGRPGQPLLPIVQPSFSLWDASIGWLSPNAKWRFGINGKNLADKGYVTNGYNIPALGILVGSYGQPRTVLATIDYKLF
ncbi:MAG TPA: TonB-dependent receptor [Thermoanaerobaculia bacterium]|jgi:iron complex outermembrane receptor protein|nr:TonB-dependent receptor [Thermoanaerobaculia bacterium]